MAKLTLGKNMIPVTKPFLPPLEKYQKYIEEIWSRQYLTNNGPLVQELENKLKSYLGVDNLLFLSNGTIALQIAIKALELNGEVITTPFSYVATTSSIVWEGCSPVFVDIDSKTLNINPTLIEKAITEKTTGILATHVFGNPCDIESIQAIANKHNIKVIYDAAHCFGTKYKGSSVFKYGDITTTSFHATKLYHTIEGGAVITNTPDLNYRMAQMRNFGHAGFDKFDGVGINGKNSEFHAAMGLCNLLEAEKILEKRKDQCLLYDVLLDDISIQKILIQEGSEWNYAYYPAIFDNEDVMLKVKLALEKKYIYPRRYFYPSLDTLDYITNTKVNISRKISERILCLPLYHELKNEEIKGIVEIIREAIN